MTIPYYMEIMGVDRPWHIYQFRGYDLMSRVLWNIVETWKIFGNYNLGVAPQPVIVAN